MKKILYIPLLFLALLSCSEKELAPITKSLGKPGIVTNVQQEPLPGGVMLTYQIPKTEDILAVKAVYVLSNGQTCESVSSYYENTLIVLGFNDQQEHQLSLFTVSRAQELSDPVTVRFTPLESPLRKVINSIEIIPDFGGANFSWENEDKVPINFEFIAQDEIGQMMVRNVYTSEALLGSRSIRGYPNAPWRFAVIISDRYGNRSDSIFPPLVLTPLYEERLDKKIWNIMRLGSDANFTNWEGMDPYIIDDDKDTFGHSANSTVPGAAYTIDMGQTAKLSRIVFFNRWFSDSYYSWGNPKAMEVYTCFTTPSSNGNWDEWTKVMDIVQIKPSGASGTTMLDGDLEYAQAGFEFSFPIEMPPTRYIRVSVLNTWENTSYSHPCEVDIYGQPDE